MAVVAVLLFVVLAGDSFGAGAEQSRIVFWSDRDRYGGDIFIMDQDGSNLTNLTKDWSEGAFDPEVSPAGRRIAFVKDDPLTPIHTGGLWVVDVDGTNLRQLTAAGRSAAKPSWSPDGSRILYSGWGPRELSVIDADGAGSPVDLFNDGRWGSWPAWSPDGSKIAYKYYSNIWLMDAESTVPVQLTHGRDAKGGWIEYQSISWTPGTVGSAVRSGSWGRLKASVKD